MGGAGKQIDSTLLMNMLRARMHQLLLGKNPKKRHFQSKKRQEEDATTRKTIPPLRKGAAAVQHRSKRTHEEDHPYIHLHKSRRSLSREMLNDFVLLTKNISSGGGAAADEDDIP